jgi:hypothetical protein
MGFNHGLGARQPWLFARASSALIAACCAGLAFGGATASAKQVQSIDLICLISVQYDFTPALNFNTVQASGSGLLSSCASPNGRYPRLKSGTVFNTNDVTASGCWPLPMRMTGGRSKIYWNDGTSSTFTVDLSSDPLAGGIRLNAFVIDGPLTGSHAAAIPTAIGQHGVCLPGIPGGLGLSGGVRSATATFGAMPIYHWEQLKSKKKSKKIVVRRQHV